MTNEWGPPLTGVEMKALRGRIDPKTRVKHFGQEKPYLYWAYNGYDYYLSANHPYYKVREYNQKHSDKPMVLHDGTKKYPTDYAVDGNVMWDDGAILSIGAEVSENSFRYVIAYTPKPKESEVSEQMPSDEAIEYGSWVDLDEIEHNKKGWSRSPKYFPAIGEVCLYSGPNCDDDHGYTWLETKLIWSDGIFAITKREGCYPGVVKWEHVLFKPLKSAVDIAAEEYADKKGNEQGSPEWIDDCTTFVAGATWRKDNPND